MDQRTKTSVLALAFLITVGLVVQGCATKMPGEKLAVPASDQKYLPTFQETFYPAPFQDKFLNLPADTECLKVDEEFVTNILVRGDERSTDIPIPMDVVFLIDQSGSMAASDPLGLRMTAVSNFVGNLAQAARDNRDNAAVVEFSNRAHGLYPATADGVPPPLSKQWNNLIAALTIGADGLTNINEAMQLANNTLLTYGVNSNKLAILLTDGCPESDAYYGIDIDQINTITEYRIPEAVDRGIRYFPVQLGSLECKWLLDDLIAQGTGGGFCRAETADNIAGCFTDIFQNFSNMMVTQDIVVEERLAPGFKYKAGTLSHSSRITLPADAETTLLSEGRIDAEIGRLPYGEQESFSFITYCRDCVAPVMPGEIVDEAGLRVVQSVDATTAPLGPARVRYQLGDGVTRYVLLDDEKVCVERPGGPTIQKLFDPVGNKVTLRIKSNYLTSHPEHVIKDVHVWDILSEYWEPIEETFSIRPTDKWGTRQSPPPFGIYYHWAVGDLQPQQEWQVSFQVRCGACLLLDGNPMGIDYYKEPSQMKMVLPGTTKPAVFTIPQAYTPNDYPVPVCTTPARPPNFGLEPTRMLREAPEYQEETGAIWIDNNSNGFVMDWTNPTQIRNSIRHTRDLTTGIVVPDLSGDALDLHGANRIYIRYVLLDGKPQGETLVRLEAKAKFEDTDWDAMDWLTVASKRLTPDEAVENKPFIYGLIQYTVLDWTPDTHHIVGLLNRARTDLSGLKEIKLRATITTADEVLKNTNSTEELIKEFIFP